jgi:hypothetical protein
VETGPEAPEQGQVRRVPHGIARRIRADREFEADRSAQDRQAFEIEGVDEPA